VAFHVQAWLSPIIVKLAFPPERSSSTTLPAEVLYVPSRPPPLPQATPDKPNATRTAIHATRDNCLIICSSFRFLTNPSHTALLVCRIGRRGRGGSRRFSRGRRWSRGSRCLSRRCGCRGWLGRWLIVRSRCVHHGRLRSWIHGSWSVWLGIGRARRNRG